MDGERSGSAASGEPLIAGIREEFCPEFVQELARIGIKKKVVGGGEEQPTKESEMQAAVQAGGGPSSSPLSGHDSSKQQQFKCDSEHPPCTAYSASGKAKKRDRNSHQSVDSSERDRSVKPDDIDSKRVKRERNGNSNKVEDINNIVDQNGGLFNFAGVERLFSLMHHQHDQNDHLRRGSTNPVAYRTLLAGVIAATDREDCLNRFAQLGGLGLLDDWLQEAHKGKIGDGGGGSKEGEKNMEELLLTLLRAFEKLPVDWDALKSCHAGKSVNNLRSHKNSEIQKKARKLVENWKKKVGADKKQSGEAKSGSIQGICWSGKPVMLIDSSHTLKNGGGSVDGFAKSPEAFVNPVKVNGNNNSSSLGEVLTKPVPVSLGKFPPGFPCNPVSVKENSSGNMLSSNSPPADIGGASVPDERSSNNQPLGNGLMWSNGTSKSAASNWKEDLKGPVNNVSANTKTGNSRPHVSGKGALGAGLNGSSCKEVGSGKPLIWSRSGSAVAVPIEKSSSMSVTSDKSANETLKMETSSNQRLIVRLPNPGRNPVPNSAVDLPASTGRGSPLERHSSLGMDSFDGKSRSQTASCIDDARAAGNTKIGGVSGPDEIGKPADLPERGNDETGTQCRTGEAECHSSESQLSFSSTHCCMAQLKESPPHRQGQSIHPRRQDSLMPNSEKCNGQGTDTENGGICLLACVAADESSRSEKDAAFATPLKNKHAADGDSIDKAIGLTDSTKQRQAMFGVGVEQADRDAKDAGQATEFHGPCSVDGTQHLGIPAAAAVGQSDENVRAAEEFSVEQRSSEKSVEGGGLPQEDRKLRDSRNGGSSCPSSKSLGDDTREEGEFHSDPSTDYATQLEIACRDALEDKKHGLARSKRSTADVSFNLVGSERYASSGDDANGREEKDDGIKTTTEATFRFPGEDALEVAMQVAKEVEQEMETYGKNTPERETLEANTNLEKIGTSKEHLESQSAKEHKQKLIECSEDMEKGNSGGQAQLHGSFRTANSVSPTKEADNTDQFEHKETNQNPSHASNKHQDHSNCGPEGSDGGHDEPNKPKHAISEVQHASPSSWPPPQNMICNPASSPEVLIGRNSLRSGTSTPEQIAEVATSAGGEAQERHDFDLNEGIVLDEGQQEATTAYYPVAPIPIIPAGPHSLASSSLSAPIAVVASTKGAFIPPVSPLRGKGQLGWKGSAATSAFRPAEPRRTPDGNPDRYQTATETDATLASSTKTDRPLLDFDLNVADEGLMLEETVAPVSLPAQNSSLTTSCNGHSGVRLDLDLNRADESEENGTVLASDLRKIEALSFSTRSNGSPGGAKPIKHDFDLNDGLTTDDATAADEPVVSGGNLRMVGNAAPPLTGFKMGGEVINLTPWPHSGAPFSAVAMPAFATVRPEAPFSVTAVPQTFFSVGQGGIPSFRTDIYRPPAAFTSSTSAAYPYPSTSAAYPYPTQSPVFPYTGFPFGFSSASFPAVSASFPAVSASFLDSAGSQQFPPGPSPILTSGAILPPHVRPSYLMGLTKIGASSNNDRIWSRPNLDLNAGPEPGDADTRDERAGGRQAAVFGGPLPLDEPMRVFRHSAEAVDPLKRKEPEGGWEVYRPGLKQETWR